MQLRSRFGCKALTRLQLPSPVRADSRATPRFIGTFGVLVALSAIPHPAPAAAPAVEHSEAAPREVGRWVTGSGNLEVEIAPCGQALCGTVVKVLSNRSMSNPNVDMVPADSRPALGMQILSGFIPASEGERKGDIYNRENGKTYRCLMSLESPDQLRIRPYVGISWFGKTQIWNRVQEPLSQK